jgi:hypothetical protein
VTAARYGTYPNWGRAIPLGTMLAVLAVETLGSSRGSRATRPTTPGPARAATSSGAAGEFAEVDRDGRVFAAVRLDARRVRASDDSRLWAGTALAEREVTPPRETTMVVAGLSAQAASPVASLVRDALAVLGRVASRYRPRKPAAQSGHRRAPIGPPRAGQGSSRARLRRRCASWCGLSQPCAAAGSLQNTSQWCPSTS